MTVAVRFSAAMLACSLALTAQERQFKIQSRLVQVPVTVTNAKGRFVEGLGVEDFRILDNGRPQKAVADTLSSGIAPISLVIAVQSAGISAPVLAKAQKIGAMIQPLITGDRGCAALVSFAERVNWLQECTNDPVKLSQAFQQLRPGEQKKARMLDAAFEAIHRLKANPDARRVLFLISETKDRGSETDLETVATMADAAAVTVYAATYSAFKTAFTTGSTPNPKLPEGNRRSTVGRDEPGSPPRRDRVAAPTPPEQRVDILGGLSELARLGKVSTTDVLAGRTGGRLYDFTRQKGLEDAVEALGGELHSQYILSFAPEAPDAGYHNIEVQVHGCSGCRVRARQGYWATGEAR